MVVDLATVAGGAVLLVLLGRAGSMPPWTRPADLPVWVDEHGSVALAMHALRAGALVLAAYVLVVAAAGAVAAGCRSDRLAGWATACTLPPLRAARTRLLAVAVGLAGTMAATWPATVGGPAPAAAVAAVDRPPLDGSASSAPGPSTGAADATASVADRPPSDPPTARLERIDPPADEAAPAPTGPSPASASADPTPTTATTTTGAGPATDPRPDDDREGGRPTATLVLVDPAATTTSVPAGTDGAPPPTSTAEPAPPGSSSSNPAGAEPTPAEPGEIAPAATDPAGAVGAGAADHLVAPGDHLWALAEAQVAAALGRPPTDAEVAPHWVRVLRVNPQLADPDLLFPGDLVHLPPVVAAP